MMLRVPWAAPSLPPETGASRRVMFFSAKFWGKCLVSAGLIVGSAAVGLWVLLRGRGVFAVLAFVDCFVFADLVGDCSAACACSAADQCAFTAAGESTDYGAAGCGAADDLCSGVFLVVAGCLFADGAVVRLLFGFGLLGECGEWEGDDGSEGHERGGLFVE